MHTMNLGAIYHQPWLEYRHALSDGRVCIRIRTGREDWDRVELLAADMYCDGPSMAQAKPLPMERMAQDENYDWYECIFAWPDPRIHYVFRLTRESISLILDQDGIYPPSAREPLDMAPFPFAYAYPEREKPDWARGCVGYQIFPDRFRREAAAQTGETVEPWTSTHYENEYRFGGNLAGIRKAVPYLKELGIGLVYMTPIFLSDTSHRYNTFDYFEVDPLLGGLRDLRDLADELHEAGIRIVLDGVFNHSGTKFPPFADALAKGPASPYYDWFFFDKKYACGYATFAHTPVMPKLNLANEAAAAYFLQVGRYWLAQAHVDGWRLDVSPEVWPDFWRQFHREILEENPQALLVAECWDDSRQWVTQGDMFDSTMHYVLSRAIWLHIGQREISLKAFDARVNRAQALYPHAVQEVLWNFLGSHDTQRFLTRAGGDESRLRAAVFFQMTHPGVPIVYYGDELGMSGGPDPDCRRPMAWDQVPGNALLSYYKQLIALRNASDALRHGAFRTVCAQEGGLYAYLRVSGSQMALAVLNTGDTVLDRMVPLPEAFLKEDSCTDSLSGEALPVTGGAIRARLAPGQGLVLLKDNTPDSAGKK